MANTALTMAALIAIPTSIISLVGVISLVETTNKLEDMVARQHDLSPVKMRDNGKRLPFVRRTIDITEVKFDESGKASISFTDSAIKNSTFTQVGCGSLANKIGQKFHVDYNTKDAVYAISCKNFKGK